MEGKAQPSDEDKGRTDQLGCIINVTAIDLRLSIALLETIMFTCIVKHNFYNLIGQLSLNTQI